MIDEKDFQKRVQKISELVKELDSLADPAARAAAKELVQLLMDLHGGGLERMLEITFQAGDAGARIIDELGEDPLVGSLLVLYGIHPQDLETRVQRKLEQLGSKLNKMGAQAKLVSVNEGAIRLHAKVEGHSCGSTTRTVRATLEEALYEVAPDLTSLVIEGLEEPSGATFVGVDALLGSHIRAAAPPVASEGMD